jgi:hypothetical protein
MEARAAPWSRREKNNTFHRLLLMHYGGQSSTVVQEREKQHIPQASSDALWRPEQHHGPGERKTTHSTVRKS